MGNKLRFYADLQSLQSDVTGSHNLVTVSYPDGRKEPFLVDFGCICQVKNGPLYN